MIWSESTVLIKTIYYQVFKKLGRIWKSYYTSIC